MADFRERRPASMRSGGNLNPPPSTTYSAEQKIWPTVEVESNHPLPKQARDDNQRQAVTRKLCRVLTQNTDALPESLDPADQHRIPLSQFIEVPGQMELELCGLIHLESERLWPSSVGVDPGNEGRNGIDHYVWVLVFIEALDWVIMAIHGAAVSYSRWRHPCQTPLRVSPP